MKPDNLGSRLRMQASSKDQITYPHLFSKMLGKGFIEKFMVLLMAVE